VKAFFARLSPAFFVVLPLASACSAPATAEATDATVADIEQGRGLVLRGSAADADLTITARMDLSSSALGNEYETSVTVARGSVEFDAYCSVSGHVDAASKESVITCAKYKDMVTDNDRLRFEIVERGGAYAVRGAQLTGTDLVEERATLVGNHGDASFPLQLTMGSVEPRRNPLVTAHTLGDVLGGLVGQTVYDFTAKASRPVKSLDYTISWNFMGGATMKFSDGPGSEDVSFSLVQHGFDASSPLLSSLELAQSVDNAIPKAPRCDTTQAPVVSPEDATVWALSPLGGPAFGFTHEVTLSSLPPAVAAELLRAGEDIASRSIEGTNYSASVNGYYAIARSCSDPTVVYYGVWGGGSSSEPGEDRPDYEDGTVIVVSLDGRRLYETTANE
jgi:hypothetical protein